MGKRSSHKVRDVTGAELGSSRARRADLTSNCLESPAPDRLAHRTIIERYLRMTQSQLLHAAGMELEYPLSLGVLER